MRVLHICGDYCSTKVHQNLYSRLDSLGVEQTIYCPLKNAEWIGRNYFEGQHTNIIYDPIVRPYHRYVYHKKLKDLFNALEKYILQYQQFDLVHAPLVFTEGGVAYEIFKKYGIPYCVAVRNTDVNAFLKYAPHTWLRGREILLHASKIFFISKGIQDLLVNHPAIKPIVKDIQHKFIFQPNGIDNYWLDNLVTEPKQHSDNINILYVGSFDVVKNVPRLIEAVRNIRQECKNIRLNIVGGGMREMHKVKLQKTIQLIENNNEFITFTDYITDKAQLAHIYQQNNIFAMPSLYESFGLVYLEALSQNTPVLYSLGQGIDQLIDAPIGIGVNPKDTQNIQKGLKMLIDNLDDYKHVASTIDFNLYSWDNITLTYYNYYKQMIKTND